MVPEAQSLFFVEVPSSTGGMRSRRSTTVMMSAVSDWISYPAVRRASERYSIAIGTPEHFIRMLLLVEDKRFALHPGVDPIAVIRALTFNARPRSLQQGASTITQQLYNIRRRYSGPYCRTLPYKLRQAAWAVRCWSTGSRGSLLAEYVSSLYWGRSYYGIDKAAKGYFGGTRESLTPAQSFFLAERIATPNAVSISRITNLIGRNAIRKSLLHEGASIRDVIDLYGKVYGTEAKAWQNPER